MRSYVGSSVEGSRFRVEAVGSRGGAGLEYCTTHIWEFPKIRGTLFWGPYNKDPTV